MKLDLACGQRCDPGWTGIDIVARPGVAIVHDLLRFPWPIESDSVEEAKCEHFIEHIPMEYRDGKELFFCFFDELHRVLKPGAAARVISPYYLSVRAFQDPTHRRFITEATFDYLNKKWREREHLDHYDVQCDFDFQYRLHYMQDEPDFKMLSLKYNVNMIADIEVLLTKRTEPFLPV